MTYSIIIQPSALNALANISDRRIQEKIRDRIDGLAHDPEKQGKALNRIIYKVERSKVVVLVVALGIRKEGDKADVYVLAHKLLRSRLI